MAWSDTNGNVPVELQGGTIVEDEFGRQSVRVSVHDEVSDQLLAGRVLLAQVAEVDFDVGETVEIALKSDETAPLVLMSLQVACQSEEITVTILEGGDGLAGGASPTILNPNRIITPTPNSEVLVGTPAAPVTGISGALISAPWVLVGQDGFGGSEYVKDTIDVGGFICRPGTWYQIVLTNTGTNNNRRCELNLKFIDPS